MNSAEGTDRHCFRWMALEASLIDQPSYNGSGSIYDTRKPDYQLERRAHELSPNILRIS